MPVGTQATVKGIPQRDLAGELDSRIILANTYHPFSAARPRADPETGGLQPVHVLAARHPYRFRRIPGVSALSDLRKVTDQGVLFRSHLDGDAHLFTPESTVDVQFAFGSDIMMVLDECLAYPASHEAANHAMRRTIDWARAGYEHYHPPRRREWIGVRAISHRARFDVCRPPPGVRE